MSKKILFVFPNTANKAWIPASIPILAGIAKSKGCECKYFDTTNYQKASDSIDDKEKTGGFIPRHEDPRKEVLPFSRIVPDLQEIIDGFLPDVIAITAMTCCYEFLMSWWGEIKTRYATTIIGGFHATVDYENVANTRKFDLICIGQGEQTFSEFLDNVIDGTLWEKNILGICWVLKHGKVMECENPRRLLDPEDLWRTEPDYSLFGEEYLRSPFDGKTINLFQIDAGRGCPYQCTYCGNRTLKDLYRGLGTYVCARPMDSTFKTIGRILKDRNVDVFSLTDECFLARPRSWLEQFCERWKKEVGKPFTIQTRAEFVSRETIEILLSTDVEFVQIGMGVESGSTRILLDVCSRTVSTSKTIEAYDLMREYQKIRTNAYFMIGFPTETKDEMWETVKLCRRLRSKINSVAIYQPFPGQKLREKCIDLGYITGKEQMQSFTGESVLNQDHISKEEIKNFWRVFMLYAKLPEYWWPEVERCEYNYEEEKELFDNLIKLRWEQEHVCRSLQIQTRS